MADKKPIFIGSTYAQQKKTGEVYGYKQTISRKEFEDAFKSYSYTNKRGDECVDIKLVMTSRSGNPFSTIVDHNDEEFKKAKEQYKHAEAEASNGEGDGLPF